MSFNLVELSDRSDKLVFTSLYTSFDRDYNIRNTNTGCRKSCLTINTVEYTYYQDWIGSLNQDVDRLSEPLVCQRNPLNQLDLILFSKVILIITISFITTLTILTIDSH